MPGTRIVALGYCAKRREADIKTRTDAKGPKYWGPGMSQMGYHTGRAEQTGSRMNPVRVGGDQRDLIS